MYERVCKHAEALAPFSLVARQLSTNARWHFPLQLKVTALTPAPVLSDHTLNPRVRPGTSPASLGQLRGVRWGCRTRTHSSAGP